MRYRQLGSSELQVSEIALGSWLTYGSGIDTATARACVLTALKQGINFIDTANIYGRGAAESFLGDALKDVARDSYVLATKLYFPMTEVDRGLSRAQIFKQIDASLTRLRTDYVDLYQCHRYDPETPLAETMQALTEVVRAGKARYIGFSEWTAQQIQAALDLSEAEPFVSSQPQYSMLWRQPESIMPLCASHGIGQIVWSPLAQGILTGKYLPGQPRPENSRWTSAAMNGFMQEYDDEQLLRTVQRLRPLADEHGLSMSQLALAWVLRQDNVAAAIIGASQPQQVIENVAASGVVLPAETLDAIDRILPPGQ